MSKLSKLERFADAPGDTMKTTTCYMCACRCGIRVWLKDGKVRYIQGNPDHPVNKGVICAKGSAGIKHLYSPARLTQPLRRVGPRGSGQFETITWEQALQQAEDWLRPIRERDPNKLAFFTGRDQSQALTGWWASQFGTHNYAAHGGFCSVNMAAGGIYSIGGSFWEFGEPDWEHSQLLMLFGVAEDHDSNPLKIGLARMKQRGAKVVSVNPVRTGYSAIADQWVPVRPGTDGLLILALLHELLRAGKIDLQFLSRYTNAIWLVIDDEDHPDHGLFARDSDGRPLCFDTATGAVASAMNVDVQGALKGRHALDDGTKVVPVMQLIVTRYLDPKYAPAAVADRVGLTAQAIEQLAADLAEVAFEQTIEIETEWVDWAGRKHDRFVGRPVSFHAMRGISAHANGFQTCRALHLLQMVLGAVDCPGGYRYKPPFPKPIPPHPKPGRSTGPNSPSSGPPLGFPQGPEDLLVDEDDQPLRIDKAFSWDYPLAAHGLMHLVIRNAWAGDPYPIDTLMMFMANMSWNSAMNTTETIDMLTDTDANGDYKIPHIIYTDAFASEMTEYADLVLPDTTYLERHDAISLLDRPIGDADGAGDSIRQPVVPPLGQSRPFQDVLLEIGSRLGLPGMVDEAGNAKYPGGYPDYIVNHERAPGIGTLAGWRGADGDKSGRGEVNPKQLSHYVDNGCFWYGELEENQRYFKMANRDYLNWAKEMGFIAAAEQIILQLYSEPLAKFVRAADGRGDHLAPASHRQRIKQYLDPLPDWTAPFGWDEESIEDYPLSAITQRPMHMYHSWGGHNTWLRQLTSRNVLYVHHQTAADLGLDDGAMAWIESINGRVKVRIQCMQGVSPNTVWTWNAIGKKKGAWRMSKDSPEANEGFLLNHLIGEMLPDKQWGNADPVTGQAAWYDLRVRLRPVGDDEQGAIK
ncbi:MAG: formate dehydrogenase [Lysobacteraceae bacterium]|nr:MAG: formate dehydrogenase [Xanthomonadaceae bacterium]